VSKELREVTTLRLGGPASRWVRAASRDEVVAAVRAADLAGEPVLVLGGGSNLVVADAGWPGVVVQLASSGIRWEVTGAVTVDAGVPWDDVVRESIERGLSGLAAMSGIPGLVGATPVQNVGAYGSEIADVLQQLEVLDRETGAIEVWDVARCGFGFRTSAFKYTDRFVILSVTLQLAVTPEAPPVRYGELARRLGVQPGQSAPSARVREVVLELRCSKGMLLDPADHDTWSVGSFFVNPFVAPDAVPDGCPNWQVDGQVKLSAAWLIENAGFGKGFATDRPGSHVGLSTKHTLALTNRGGATTAELLDVAREIRDGVEARFNVRLRPEAHLVGVEL
jgi:UDP-N-acetylmuramate dehydrogenase